MAVYKNKINNRNDGTVESLNSNSIREGSNYQNSNVINEDEPM